MLWKKRPALVIDIGAIGLSRMDDHLGAKLFEEQGSYWSSGPVRAVKHHPQGAEGKARAEGSTGEGEVCGARIGRPADAPNVATSRSRARRALENHVLEMVLLRIGELETIGREEFDPVVFE